VDCFINSKYIQNIRGDICPMMGQWAALVACRYAVRSSTTCGCSVWVWRLYRWV